MAFLKFVQGRADEDRRDTLKSAFENRAEKRMAGPICQGAELVSAWKDAGLDYTGLCILEVRAIRPQRLGGLNDWLRNQRHLNHAAIRSSTGSAFLRGQMRTATHGGFSAD